MLPETILCIKNDICAEFAAVVQSNYLTVGELFRNVLGRQRIVKIKMLVDVWQGTWYMMNELINLLKMYAMIMYQFLKIAICAAVTDRISFVS